MQLRILQSDSRACNLTASVVRYRFAEYREDQYVRLQRFADYTARDDAPNYQTGNKIAYPDELLFQIVPEASTRVAGLEAGEYLAASNYDGEKVIVQTIASSASHVRTGLSIAEQLQSVGINAEMVQYDVQTWVAKRRDPNEFNIYTSGGTDDQPVTRQYRIGNPVGEVLVAHRREMSRGERRERVVELLRLVGIPSPEQRVASYPHHLSGGMRQRVMIAIALAGGETQLLIADEPTTALDVTIQAQVLELFQELQRRIGMAVMLITHDLGVVAETAGRVAVMYAGSVVEYATVDELFARPGHPYTQGLLRSLPQRGRDARKSRLFTVPGAVPDLLDLEPGCKFFARCLHAVADVCLGSEPPLEAAPAPAGAGHLVRSAGSTRSRRRSGPRERARRAPGRGGVGAGAGIGGAPGGGRGPGGEVPRGARPAQVLPG